MLVASFTLLFFFFFDMHKVILGIYIMGATLSVALVFIYPKLKEKSTNGISSAEASKILYSKKGGNNDDWNMIFSLLIAALITSTWYFYRYTAWSWIIQDFMVIIF